MLKGCFFGLFLILSMDESLTLRCYVCSDFQTGCSDWFTGKNVTVQNCSGSCAKTKRYYDSTGHVDRFCTPGHPNPDCVRVQSTEGDHDIYGCVCNTDLCNSASLTNISWTSIILCVLKVSHSMCVCLQCYQCNFCNDPFQTWEANVVNCTGSCEKLSHNGNFVRLCSPEPMQDNCITHRTRISSGQSCACNGELCNGTELLQCSVVLLMCLIFILFV